MACRRIPHACPECGEWFKSGMAFAITLTNGNAWFINLNEFSMHTGTVDIATISDGNNYFLNSNFDEDNTTSGKDLVLGTSTAGNPVLVVLSKFRSAGNTVTEGSGNRIRNNISYLTENSGTDSIASGATSATVTHGLSYTPAEADIVITLTESPANTPGLYRWTT